MLLSMQNQNMDGIRCQNKLLAAQLLQYCNKSWYGCENQPVALKTINWYLFSEAENINHFITY